MEISALSNEQLKALGYDQQKALNQAQANINVIDAELERRLTEARQKAADEANAAFDAKSPKEQLPTDENAPESGEQQDQPGAPSGDEEN